MSGLKMMDREAKGWWNGSLGGRLGCFDVRVIPHGEGCQKRVSVVFIF